MTRHLSGPFSGWGPSLRMARRDALRARGRSILVLVMIALPVLAVTAADIVIATQSISGGEALERRIGGSDALVTVTGGGEVQQAFDPDDGTSWSGDGTDAEATLGDVRRALGRDVRGVELRTGSALVATDRGKSDVQVTEVDLTDPLSAGLFELEEGRWPTSADEVVVNADLASRGPGLGDQLELSDGAARKVVGLAESASYTGYPIAAGPLGVFDLPEPVGSLGTGPSWLVSAGPVSWDDVRALNLIGTTVVSRAVLTDPPPESALPPEIAGWDTGVNQEYLSVLILVVTMALLEVVLLAGPAFAVTARRQARNLALIAASGGTPRQARRVVLASGVVLGAVAAVLGVLLGILTGWTAVPIVQRFDSTRFGPFDVPWLHLVGIAGFGLLSALLAAVVPAWLASRQDVVAVLAGRRGDRRPSLRSPVLGVVLLGAGIAAAAYGATRGSAVLITVSAIVSVLGMILLVPVVVVLAARLSRRLPLVMRYAVRDAARHRTRTVPAVAAVAATVAGVVALGIAVSSDEAENVGRYSPSLPMGVGVAVLSDQAQGRAEAARAAVAQAIPDAQVTELRGVRDSSDDGSGVMWSVQKPGSDGMLVQSYGSTLGSPVLVSDGDVSGVAEIPADDRARAGRTLAAGGVVAFTERAVEADEATVVVERYSAEGETTGHQKVRVPATYVVVGGLGAGPLAVVAPAVATRLDVPVVSVGLLVSGTEITRASQRDATEALQGVTDGTSFYVERGYQAPGETVVIQLVLGALGAVLMLGGTLTATFLALSDSRPDLATLSAVGATPRMRRGVAASYALVVGGVGALLGAAVGFIPGIAITYPLTNVSAYGPTTATASHYVDIPWLLILALVVVLPLLTAALVGALARSRLPLVSRLD